MTLLAPVDIAASATSSQYVELANVGSGQLEFAVQFGVITATDSTGSVTVTIAGASDSVTDTSPTAVAFYYRVSSAVGTDSLGTLTASGSTGYVMQSTDPGRLLLCYVDPAALGDNYKYARVTLTPVDSPTATLVSVQARFVPRYAQASNISAT